MSAIDRARALLDEASRASRGELKRLASVIEADPELRGAVVEEGRRRGAELPDEAASWPGKRLLRVARGLESEARVRRNPIHRDEGFTCVVCGAVVEPLGRTARDHCPACLRSLHVDVVPGDRAAGCGGVLEPIGLERRGGDEVIRYRCARCGVERANRAAEDDAREVVRALASRGG